MTNLMHTLFYNMFIMILYMFRALYAHHQEDELYWCSIWQRTEFSLNLCTGQPLTESEDTRCCISTVQQPDDEYI